MSDGKKVDQALIQPDFDVGIPILGTLNLGVPKINPRQKRKKAHNS